MKYIFITTFLLSFLNTIVAQTDSIVIEEEVKDEKTKFLFSFDNRNSSVLDQPVKFNGLKIGVEYLEVHDLGFGFYSTSNPVRKKAKNSKSDIIASLNYTTLFYQYAFVHNKKWELAFPVHLGSGSGNLQFVNPITDSITIENGRRKEQIIKYSVAEIGFDAQYKIFKWFGLGSGLGYRFTFNGDDNLQKMINAPVFSFKIKIFLGELYRSIKEKVKKRDESNN